METTPSPDLQARAQRVLGGVPGTYSKANERYAVGVTPYCLESGTGCYVYDSQGRRYIDTICGLGPVLLGHGDPRVTEAIMHSVVHGMSMSCLTELEIRVAEQLCALMPSAEMVRFSVSGSDVTNAAVRIAREVTGRPHILACGYHGSHDWYISSTSQHGGILPEVSAYTHQFAWGDLETVTRLLARYPVAAIILEIPPLPAQDDPSAFLTRTQAAASTEGEGALFILDEVVTGLRYHPAGAQHLYGLTPDLTCLSKALGNGAPIAALGGRRDLMTLVTSGQVFMSATFAGNTLGLAGAEATLAAILEDWGDLYTQGSTYIDRMRAMFAEANLPCQILGNYARIRLEWQDTEAGTAHAWRTLWMAENARRQVLYGPGVVYPMTCWTPGIVYDILHAAEASVEVLQDVAAGRIPMSEALPGPVAMPVFAVRP